MIDICSSRRHGSALQHARATQVDKTAAVQHSSGGRQSEELYSTVVEAGSLKRKVSGGTLPCNGLLHLTQHWFPIKMNRNLKFSVRVKN